MVLKVTVITDHEHSYKYIIIKTIGFALRLECEK